MPCPPRSLQLEDLVSKKDLQGFSPLLRTALRSSSCDAMVSANARMDLTGLVLKMSFATANVVSRMSCASLLIMVVVVGCDGSEANGGVLPSSRDVCLLSFVLC